MTPLALRVQWAPAYVVTNETAKQKIVEHSTVSDTTDFDLTGSYIDSSGKNVKYFCQYKHDNTWDVFIRWQTESDAYPGKVYYLAYRNDFRDMNYQIYAYDPTTDALVVDVNQIGIKQDFNFFDNPYDSGEIPMDELLSYAVNVPEDTELYDCVMTIVDTKTLSYSYTASTANSFSIDYELLLFTAKMKNKWHLKTFSRTFLANVLFQWT